MAGGEKHDLHLPQEIICSEILTRLPVKSILRFRSVCKSWHSLISCPNFKPKTLSDRILVNCEDRPGLFSLHRTEWSLAFSGSRDISEDLRGMRIQLIIGSCDGLICLLNNRVDRSKNENVYFFIVYNPAIRKIVDLPPLSFDLRTQSIDSSFYAFGFDSKASDYKVIIILRFSGDKSDVGFKFDLRNGVWSEFTPIVPNYNYAWMHCPKFYLDDAVHGIGYNFQNVKFIRSFDLSDQKFRVISMPEELSRGFPLITTYGGLIYAFEGRRQEISGQQICSVWVMREYGVTESWTKVFTIKISSQFWPTSVCALIFRGPEVVDVLSTTWLADEGRRLLILHNDESGESKCLFNSDKSFKHMVFYKESLVLM